MDLIRGMSVSAPTTKRAAEVAICVTGHEVDVLGYVFFSV